METTDIGVMRVQANLPCSEIHADRVALGE
jgi:hypothetical protein